MITDVEYLKGRDQAAPLDEQMVANMTILLAKLNALFQHHYRGPYYGISSGYRPATINAAAGGAKRSAHLTCEAADLRDPQNKIGKFLRDNEQILQVLDLYMEDPAATPGWCHLQSRKTSSGRRVFKP